MQYLFTKDKDEKVVAYVMIGLTLLLPYIYTLYGLIKWFRYDGPETRPLLPRAFAVSLLVQLGRGLWAIFGSLMLFGKLLPLYLYDKFPEHFLEELEEKTPSQLRTQLSQFFLSSTIIYMVVSLPLTFYFMGVSKRLKPHWQPMPLKSNGSLG